MQVLRTALASAELRRLLLAFAATSLGTWAFAVLFALYAYAEAGATAVGLAILVRMLPAGLAAPSLALLADRYSRRSVLLVSASLQAVALMLLAASVALGAPFAVVLGMGALVTIAGAVYKPAQAALLPKLAESPAQIAAGNVAWSMVDYTGFLTGSLLAAALVGLIGPAAGFATCAVPFVVGAVMVMRLPRDDRPELHPEDALPRRAQLAAGLATIRAHPEMRLLMGILGANMLVQGIIDVLLVVTAIELLGIGESGVGWLNSMWAAGGLVGGFVALTLLARGRLASGVAVGCVLAGLPLVGIGLWHEPAAAVALLVVLGIGYALLESSLLTLTQRLASDDVLARVFGVQETLFVVGSATGGLTGAALVAALGLDATLMVTGLALPALAVVLRRRLRELDAGAVVPERAYALFRGLPMFAPLPIAMIENLATHAAFEQHPAGTEIIRQGEQGEHFYVVEEGTLDVLTDGRLIAQCGAGDCVGEIALLRSQPRMATVLTTSPVRLVVLDRGDFLAGVSGHARSTREADRLAGGRLNELAGATT